MNNERLKKLEHYQNDDDIEFKKIIVKILGTLADSNDIDYKKIFTSCLEQIEKNTIVEDSIPYIYQQSKDEKRCQELFTPNVICRIIDLLNNTNINEQIKIHICGIIKNYLEYSYSRALKEPQLKIYVHTLNDSHYNSELKVKALRSIILTTIKTKIYQIFLSEF